VIRNGPGGRFVACVDSRIFDPWPTGLLALGVGVGLALVGTGCGLSTGAALVAGAADGVVLAQAAVSRTAAIAGTARKRTTTPLFAVVGCIEFVRAVMTFVAAVAGM
jgi:hypothetical protein